MTRDGTRFYYTAQNRRDAVVNAAGVFRFGFDASGRRSTQWDNNSASVNQTQYYAAGQAVAFWSATDGNIHFEHQDWLGTDRMRTDLNGSASTVASFSSLPFGEPNATGGADLNSAHFTGLDQDGSFSASSLGLHHATFREYNSTLGRWMSPDPYSGSYDLSNPQSLNRYSYVQNNPLESIDPSGEMKASYCIEYDSGACPNGGGGGGGYTVDEGYTFGSGWDPFGSFVTINTPEAGTAYSSTESWENAVSNDPHNLASNGTIYSDGTASGTYSTTFFGLTGIGFANNIQQLWIHRTHPVRSSPK